jgi:hypothetical protein
MYHLSIPSGRSIYIYRFGNSIARSTHYDFASGQVNLYVSIL